MITDTRERIIAYIREHHQARVHDLVSFLNLSNMAVHKQVKRLTLDGVLQKAGKPPLVFYTLAPQEEVSDGNSDITLIKDSAREFIEENFLHITPDGKLLYGSEGFSYWQKLYQSKKSISSIAEEYASAINEKQKYVSSGGWIDATEKAKSTFAEKEIDHLLYADVYSYPTFGKTKLAKLVMHAKQSENKELVLQISSIVRPMIEKVLKKFAIDAVAYIPPTVPRPVQFMEELSAQLNLPLPHINLVKVLAGTIPVPQKTLAKLDERILNAQSTIFIKSSRGEGYKHVLLIDDAAGSGASFHETAKKLRALGIASKSIIAFALVGNIKGFDVIRQM